MFKPKTKKIRFVKEGSSPVYGNIWKDRILECDEKTAQKFLSSGAAVEVLDTDQKAAKQPEKVKEHGKKDDAGTDDKAAAAGDDKTDNQDNTGKTDDSDKSDVDKAAAAGDDKTDNQDNTDETVKDKSHGSGHHHRSKTASKGHKHK